MKYLLLLLISCSTNKVRSIASIKLPCIKNLSNLVKNPKEGKLQELIKRKDKLSLYSRNLVPLEKEINFQLNLYIKEGNILFDHGQNFNSKNLIPIPSNNGAENDGIFRYTHNDNYIIKKLRSNTEPITILREISNAKIINILGFGPEAFLVKSYQKNELFLVLEKVHGINLKEIYAGKIFRTNNTKNKLSSILNVSNLSMKELLKLFTKKILEDESYIKRLKEIDRKLKAIGFSYLRDLQVMVDLRKGPLSINIIDSAHLYWKDENLHAHDFDPLQNIITSLKRLLESH